MKSSLRRVLGLVVCAVLGTATALCFGAGSAAAATPACNGLTPGGDVAVFCLWSQPNFTGEEIKIGPRWQDPNLQTMPGPGTGNVWNDALSSVQVTPAYQDLFTLRLFRDVNDAGPEYDVTVSGNLGSFSGKTSAYIVEQTNNSRSFPVPTCSGSAMICLWSGYNYTGAELLVYQDPLVGNLTAIAIPSAFYTTNSRTWNDQISSIQFNPATCGSYLMSMEIATGVNNSGTTSVLVGNAPVPSLHASVFDDTISYIGLSGCTP